MARGGINKALVLKAREEVLKKGQNPSIDTIRIALGNTGSKSTIHRYLKELDEESAIRMDDVALLSQPIKELIARLASGLREEAQSIVGKQTEQFEEQLQDLRAKNSELTQALDVLNKKHTTQLETLERVEIEVENKNAALHKSETNAAVLKQSESKLTALLNEKQTQIQSLEEKHHHNREALEHYRQSVKEQRDQDQRRQEQQVQQLHGENRILNQTLSMKQADITHLNMDNAGLNSELGAAQKTLNVLKSDKNGLANEVKTLELSEQSLSTQLQASLDHINSSTTEIAQLRGELGDRRDWKQDSMIKIAQLEAGISAKNDLINQLIAEQRNNTSDVAGSFNNPK